MYKLTYGTVIGNVHEQSDDIEFLKGILRKYHYKDNITWDESRKTIRAFIRDELVGWIHN